MTTNTKELLEQAGSFSSDERDSAGQPAYASLPLRGLLRKRPVQVAKLVCVEVLRLGGNRHGTPAKAVNNVARRERLSPSSVKKNYQRYREHVEGVARLEYVSRSICGELDRRMAVFPKDVREKIENLASPEALIAYLQDHEINGIAPHDLIEWVRKQ